MTRNTNKVLASTLVLAAFTGLSACSGGGAGSNPNPTPLPPPPPPPSGDVTISGTLTYDFVPLNTTTNGLNYTATQMRPIRGATVQLLDSTGTVIDSLVSSETGSYSFTVTPNTEVRVRVRAELLKTDGPSWDVQVQDNTSGNALYLLAGQLSSSGTTNQTRDLNAGSGWGGTSYTGTRAAAPFAILDSVYEAVTTFADVDPAIVFPEVDFRWSVNNTATSGNRANGDIGTTSYVSNATDGNVFILGDAGDDTDEYDRHVIVHEWGHYFEDMLSRSDSIGGSHSVGQRLDARLALGEGWGNAVSAIVLGDPVYRDSSGTQQSTGFSVNVENNNYGNEGWFNEGSTQSIIYDIFDADNDGADGLSLGLAPIYEAMTSPDYLTEDYFTTIFSWVDQVKDAAPTAVTDINSLLAAQDINGDGPDGNGETNAGNVPESLPVYKAVTIGGGPVEICSTAVNGEYNKLGDWNYLDVDVTAAGTYTVRMARVSGPTDRDPDFYIYRDGALIDTGLSPDPDIETLSLSLPVGRHVISAHDFKDDATACYDFSVSP